MMTSRVASEAAAASFLVSLLAVPMSSTSWVFPILSLVSAAGGAGLAVAFAAGVFVAFAGAFLVAFVMSDMVAHFSENVPGSDGYLLAGLQISKQTRVWHTLAPLPLLADACELATGGLVVFYCPEANAPNAWLTGTDLTDTLLLEGGHPQSRSTQARYERLLSVHSNLDAKELVFARETLNFETLARGLRLWDDGSVQVVIPYDKRADALIAWIRSHGGRLPSRDQTYMVRVTSSSARMAVERGQAEQVGNVLIWSGTYDSTYGVGLG